MIGNLLILQSYLLFEVPSNMLLARSKPAIFLPSIMVTWGAVSIIVAAIHNLAGMVCFRFALGIIEAGFFPGVVSATRKSPEDSADQKMLLLSCWYKPQELSKRIAFFYTASLVSGAFGGLIAGGLIEGMEGLGGIRGWKWLFMIEGAATVLIAIGAYFVLPSMFSILVG